MNPIGTTDTSTASPHHTFNLAPKHQVPEEGSLEDDGENSDDKQPLSIISQGADVPARPLETLSNSSQSELTIEHNGENSNDRRSLDQQQKENRYYRQVTRAGEQHSPAAGAEPNQGERADRAGADGGVEVSSMNMRSTLSLHLFDDIPSRTPMMAKRGVAVSSSTATASTFSCKAATRTRLS